jgi:ribonuclease PH
VALADALDHLHEQGLLDAPVPLHQIASVSVGLQQGEVLLDLDYSEDSTADTDMNFVMNDEKRFIEIQGTAEHSPFSDAEMQKMTAIAVRGIEELMRLQRLARETD